MLWVPWNNEKAVNRLQTVLESWKGTPYRPGQQAKGFGVDCVRFVTGVLDELRGTSTPIKRLPPALSLHNSQMATAALHEIISAFPSDVLEDTETVEPGDIIVCRIGHDGGPGHVYIVGGRPYEIWHSMEVCGVTQSGLASVKYLLRCWRYKERELWA
jgi:cell wall-associated NlpC family hydrolase